MLATPTVFGGGPNAVAKINKIVTSASAANSLRHLRRGGMDGCTSISPAAEEASYPSPDANDEPSNYYPTTFQSPGGYFPDDSYRNYFSESSEDEYQPPCSKCHPAGPETLDMNIHYCLARQESDLQ